MQLETKARLALADSGSVQKEMCILGVTCVKRPETLEVGSNVLAGADGREGEGDAAAGE
jgi:UDP-N-acetylglucosamine 2-epimerase